MAETGRPRDVDDPGEDRIARRLVPWILLVGLTVRAIHYFAGRSLWLDEAMLALNIERRSFGELVGTLDFQQASPVGFLWLEKLAATVLGAGEMALRLWPYLAAVAALVFFAALARRLLRPGAALVVLAGFALSGSLIYYAAEVKPYAFDVLCSTAILWLAHRSASGGPRVPLAAAGAVGLWLSFPLVFVLPGALVYLWLARAGDGRTELPEAEQTADSRLDHAALAGIAALWGASFAAAFWLGARGASESPLMARFWTEGFMPVPPTSLAELGWFLEAATDVLRNTIDFTEAVDAVRGIAIAAGGLLAIVGVAHAWGRERRVLFLVATPILLALLASALALYPFRGRLILFLVPSTLLLVGWGIEAGLARARMLRMAAVAVGLAWLAGAGTATLQWLRSPQREELRPVLEAVSSRLEPGDVVYLHSGAQHAQLFYERTCAACSLETATVVRGAFLAGDPGAIEAEADALLRTGRLWALFAHEWWGYGDTERDALVARLRERATRVEALEAPGAEAYLFDLTGTGAASDGAPR